VDGQTDGQSAMLNAARLSTDVTDASIAPSPFLSAECWKIGTEQSVFRIDIRNTDCLSTFQSKLKTHFFTASYT